MAQPSPPEASTESTDKPEPSEEIIPSEASSSEVLAATSACHKKLMKKISSSRATLPEPEALVTTSAYSPELLKEVILKGGSPLQVLPATTACHKELMKEIICNRATLPEPEALVTTSAYNPEILKEIILRGGSPSQVPPATTACHKELMKEIVSRQARIPEMDYYEQVMHYLTTKRPDSSIAKLNARASRAILVHHATWRDHLVVNKHTLLIFCVWFIETCFVSILLAMSLQSLSECNRARHALLQTAGAEMRAAY